MSPTSMIFVGIAGTVVALDRTTGTEVWRSRLKNSDFVNVAILDGDLYASTAGELFCLHPATGGIRWQNPLKAASDGGLMTIATIWQPAGRGDGRKEAAR